MHFDADAGSGPPRKCRAASAVRQSLNEAKQSLAQVCSDSEFNQFVRDHVGEIVVEADGSLRPKDEPVPRAHVAEAICTQGLAPQAFWGRFSQRKAA